MSKEKIKAKLMKYQIKFSESDDTLNAKITLSQEMQITFSDDNKVFLTDKFVNWNPLSGIFKISLRNAILFQTIAIITIWLLLLVIFSSLKFGIEYFEFITMGLVCSWGFTILWSTYYLIKLENFKRTLISWLDECTFPET